MPATLWNPSPAPFFTSDGSFASGAKAFFHAAKTSSPPLTVYQDAALTISHPVPVAASNIGVFPAIFLPFADYRVRILDQNGGLIFDADDISNPAPPASGGGIIVTSDMVLQTGDPFWRLRTGTMIGFVRMNAETIGSAASAATEYKNNLSQNLFIHLWTNLTDADAPVSGGRGAFAADDFAANKTIGIPTMRGYLAAGLDDMGGASAGVLQAVTTCTTNGTTTVTVVSAAGIAVGQNAIVAGIGGRTVTAINGTGITLSSAVAGTGSGIAFRASWFTNATVMAAAAGVPVTNITTDQMPAHTHTFTGNPHSHTYEKAIGALIFGSGGVFGMNVTSPNATDPATAGGTNSSTGGGNPFRTLPPTRLGTWYMKL